MAGIEAVKELYSAAAKGDVNTIQQLLHQDPYLLHLVSFPCSRNLLHIATMHKQPDIVNEILSKNSQLAGYSDSQKWSPLHIAAAEGHFEIASKLLQRAPKMLWSRDDHGMNPVHIAAMNGHAEVLKELVQSNPDSAMERVDRGQTALHLCAKHGQLDALKVLVEKVEKLVRVQDDDGDNVLHLAIRYKHVQIIKYLVANNKVDTKSRNSKGETAFKIMGESFHNDTSSEVTDIIGTLFARAMFDTPRAYMKQMSDVTMVVAVLIATMAYQSAVSPPGGVWQKDSPQHKAGEAVMASHHPELYEKFVSANTTAFVSSLISIFMLSMGLPLMSSRFMFVVVCTVWVSLASIAVSYGASVTVITPQLEPQSLDRVINLVVVVSVVIGIFGLSFIGLHFFPWLRIESGKHLLLLIKQRWKTCDRNNTLGRRQTLSSGGLNISRLDRVL